MPNATKMPAQLVAGDTWTWCDASAFASHPAPDWALHYVLRPVTGGAAITIIATWSDDVFRLSRSATDTAGDAPGDFEWTALAYNDADGERVRLSTGRVCVLPDPAAATGDLRSNAERILAAIDATIEGRATKDAESYSIEGRSIARTPIADLMKIRGIYERRVSEERNPGGSFIQFRRVQL